MSGHDDGDALLIAQLLQVLPQIAARAGIEAGGRFIEQQDAGPVHQSFGQLDAALHAPGKSLDFLFGAIRQSHALQHLGDALLQHGPSQAVQMALMPEVFGCGQFDVNALGLEDHSDAAADFIRLPGRIETCNQRSASGWQHQRRKDSEQRCLSAAVRPKQGKNLAGTHVK